MKIYKFDKDSLEYKQLNKTKLSLLVVIFLIGFTTFIFLFSKKEIEKIYVNAEQELTIQDKNEFSKEKLVQLIKDLNIKHPEIAYSQFVFESGHFNSPLFKNQNNLMGMRLATTRPTTAIGQENGYAVYKDWTSCVVDYAIYQSSFLRKASKEEYYHFLQQIYVEHPNYTDNLKTYIQKNNVNKLFS